MDALPDFRVLNPRRSTRRWRRARSIPTAEPLGGGTDLVVNIRRGIVAPTGADRHEPRAGTARDQGRRDTRSRSAPRCASASWPQHPDVIAHYPVLAQAAAHIAGPTHRNMGTVGGNLCLDTRCIYYNQSEWWRGANHHCLKTTGTMCHVAPKSRGVCFATYSGDLAPALLALQRRSRHRRPGRQTHHPARAALYRLRPPGRAGDRDARRRQILSVAAAGRDRRRGARQEHARPALGLRQDPHPPLDRISGGRRRGGAQARRRHDSPTCASPSPAPIRARCCSPAPPSFAAAASTSASIKGLDALVRDQIMPMKTTFTPGHYRRRVAGVLARRLMTRLFES